MLTTITKEPSAARLTSDNVIIKDHFFYKGNEFSWNRPSRMSQKFYPYYHKQQYENKSRIENMKQQEVEDNKFIEEIRKEKLITKKIITQETFKAKAKEREVVQKMSNQAVTNIFTSPELSEEDRKGMYEIVAKKLNSGKTLRSDEFSWNKLNLASKKNISIFLGKYSVKGEEEMIQKYKEKVEAENQKELEKNAKKEDFHKKTRLLFLSRHEENMAKDELVSRPATATAKTSFFNTPRLKSLNGQIPLLNLAANSNVNRNVVSPSENSNDLGVTYARPVTTDLLRRPQTTQSIERLALSKHTLKKEFHIDQTDVKGMLVQNMDEKVYVPGNDFYEALLAQSKVFQEILDDNKTSKRNISSQASNSRKKFSITGSNKSILTRPATSHSKKNLKSRTEFVIKTSVTPGAHRSIETEFDVNDPLDSNNEMYSKKATLNDLDLFENKFCKSGKRVGYARVNLEEAYRLTSATGLAALQKIEAKKQEPLII